MCEKGRACGAHSACSFPSGQCVASATSGILLPVFSSSVSPTLLSGLHLRLLCGGLEAEMGRWAVG